VGTRALGFTGYCILDTLRLAAGQFIPNIYGHPESCPGGHFSVSRLPACDFFPQNKRKGELQAQTSARILTAIVIYRLRLSSIVLLVETVEDEMG
jgi:hypothetical protein